MEKELLKNLKEINEILESILEDDVETSNGLKQFNKIVDNGFKEKAYVSIKKAEDGTADVRIEGTTIAILIALASLEKAVLEKNAIPTEIWNIIKSKVGTREVKTNE